MIRKALPKFTKILSRRNLEQYGNNTISVSLIPYIGNHSQKKTFANFADFGMIANVFSLPFSILHISRLNTCMVNSHRHFITLAV